MIELFLSRNKNKPQYIKETPIFRCHLRLIRDTLEFKVAEIAYPLLIVILENTSRKQKTFAQEKIAPHDIPKLLIGEGVGVEGGEGKLGRGTNGKADVACVIRKTKEKNTRK